MIDIAQARQYITALTGSPTSVCVFQSFDEDANRKDPNLTRVLIGTIDQHAAELSRLNDAQAGCYVQVNIGVRRGVANITGLRALFIDDDGQNPLPVIPHIPPSITVQTSADGRHWHHLWLLRPGESVARFKPSQKRLARALNTDKSMTNADRVLRIPGTTNRKPEREPFVARLTVCEPLRLYSVDEIVAPLPDEIERAIPEGEQAPFEITDGPPSPAGLNAAKRVKEWLDRRKVEYTQQSEVAFRLVRCPLNSAHKDARILALSSGAIWGGCFHNSCGGNTQAWQKFRIAIGGWRASNGGFIRGDHAELGERLLSDMRLVTDAPCVFSEGKMWRYSPVTGMWEVVSEEDMWRLLHNYAGLPVGINSQTLKLKATDSTGAIRFASKISGQVEFFTGVNGIAFQNGFLAINESGAELHAHSPENRARFGYPFAFDETATAPRFERFLTECFGRDDDGDLKIAMLQEFVGACLCGIVTKYQNGLMFYGESGSNGKSTFMEIALALFPPDARSAVKPQDFSNEYYRRMLVGIRLNAVGEIPEADILDTGPLKQIFDGSLTSGRDPAKPAFDFHPIAGHIFSANTLPAVRDHSGGFWRRFHVVKWNRHFTEAEQDPNLRDYIVENEIPGVIVWALHGARRLLQFGDYTVPPSSALAKAKWRYDSDALLQFLDECTELVPGFESGTTGSVIYDTYSAWCYKTEHRRLSSNRFGERLKQLVVHNEDRLHRMLYGLRLVWQAPYLGA